MYIPEIIKEIDRTVKEIWLKNIPKDFNNSLVHEENALKCCFYYHLRRKLSEILNQNHLKIYPDYNSDVFERMVDIAIVQVSPFDFYVNERPYREPLLIAMDFAVSEYIDLENNTAALWQNYAPADNDGGRYNFRYYFADIDGMEFRLINETHHQDVIRNMPCFITQLDAHDINGRMIFEVHSPENV